MFLFGKASMDTALPATRTRIASWQAMWYTHLTWKMLGQPVPKCWLSKTMMLVNVCACFDVMISPGWPAKLPRRCSFFLSFGQLTFFFFLFSFLQCFWPCPFFFLQGPMLSWKVIIWIILLNLHGATRSTRSCNKRASLSAWLSLFLQHVGQHHSKNDHDEEIKAGPLDLSFWSFLTFLHHGIEEVERHLLWKFYKKIRRKSWSNVPPKLVACIGFLYKVVHKIGCLRKFNRSRGF